MRKAEKLFEAIGYIPAWAIEDAERRSRQEKPSLWKPLAAVLALLLLPGIIISSMWLFSGGMGSSCAPGSMGNCYDLYEGPVFPLTCQEAASDIAVERNTNFDFSPYRAEEVSWLAPDGEQIPRNIYEQAAIITDDYLLTNTGTEDQTLSFCYLTAANLVSSQDSIPEITVDGNPVETTWQLGDVLGWKGGEYPAWEGCERELKDKALPQQTEAAAPHPVTVLKLSNFQSPEQPEGEEHWKPMVKINLTLSNPETKVMDFGMPILWREDELHQYYACEADKSMREFESTYILVWDGEVTDYSLQGYRGFNCDPGTELDSVTAEVTTYESTIEAVLAEILPEYFEYSRKYEDASGTCAPSGEVTNAIAQMLVRQEDLDSIGLAGHEGLVTVLEKVDSKEVMLYHSFSVTIPAGQTVSVSARYVKRCSSAMEGKDAGIVGGYDLLTSLGSNLRFTTQTASLSNEDAIEIVDQNFGFDLKKGITRVTLDLNEPEYYLNVKKKE